MVGYYFSSIRNYFRQPQWSHWLLPHIELNKVLPHAWAGKSQYFKYRIHVQWTWVKIVVKYLWLYSAFHQVAILRLGSKSTGFTFLSFLFFSFCSFLSAADQVVYSLEVKWWETKNSVEEMQKLQVKLQLLLRLQKAQFTLSFRNISLLEIPSYIWKKRQL